MHNWEQLYGNSCSRHPGLIKSHASTYHLFRIIGAAEPMFRLGLTKFSPCKLRTSSFTLLRCTHKFAYRDIFEIDQSRSVPTSYRELSTDYTKVDGNFLYVKDEALRLLTQTAFVDISHLFRTSHLQQLASILKDNEATSNDKFVALELLKNACISADMVLPSCQDTGSALITARKGQFCITESGDPQSIAKGVFDAYTTNNLRYSQVAPTSMMDEINTACNLPAQIDIACDTGNEFHFQFMAKGGGSSNKTSLYQQTRAILEHDKLLQFLTDKIRTIGTAACPPYHLAVVIGGLSPEMTLKTAKLAASKYYDALPVASIDGGAFRDLEWEAKLLKISQDLGLGAQFGGKYFCHDVRVLRLPRHGASCPIGLAVSCAADRQAVAKITKDGVFLEELERNPHQFLPEVTEKDLLPDAVNIDLNQPMTKILETLSKYPVKTRVNLNGPMIVARDIAHAKLAERLKMGQKLPRYFQDHIIFYAGPAKTPKGLPSGSLGPTTAGRMDTYVDRFQKSKGSMIMLAKGNRSKEVTRACKANGGFYLGSIGGAAAQLALNSVRKSEIVEYAELGMEAIYRIEVENFPAFILIDNKGNDFFEKWRV